MRYMRLYDFSCSCSDTEKNIISIIYAEDIKDIRLTESSHNHYYVFLYDVYPWTLWIYVYTGLQKNITFGWSKNPEESYR